MIWWFLLISLARSPEVHVETSLDEVETLVGGRVIYSIRLTYQIVPPFGDIRPVMQDLSRMGIDVLPIAEMNELDTEVRDGETYLIETFHFALFPRFAGYYRIPPPKILFGQETIPGQSLGLEVMPLPAGFNGLVGDWEISAKLSATTAFAGSRIGYFIELSGTGNPHLIRTPQINLPPGIRHELISEDRDVLFDGGELHGTISLQYHLWAEKEGDFIIPPQRIETIDPQSRVISTVETEPLSLRIIASPGARFPEIKRIDKLEKRGRPFYLDAWFIFVQAIPLIAVSLAALSRVRFIRRRFYLWRFTRRICNAGNMPDVILRELNELLSRVTDDPSASVDQIERSIGSTAASEEIIAMASEIVEECKRARYSEKKALDPEIVVKAQRFAVKIVSVLSIVLVLSFIADADEVIDRANAELESGNYREALTRYLMLSEEYRDARLFYNIGVTYLRLNEPVRAVFWLEKARRLSPMDDEISSAIEHANLLLPPGAGNDVGNPALVVLIAIAVYWLLAGTIIFGILKRRKNVLLISVILGALFLSGAICLWWMRDSEALVLERAPIRSVPHDFAPSLGVLPEGMKVRVKTIKPGWAEIVAPTGQRGWIERKAISPFS